MTHVPRAGLLLSLLLFLAPAPAHAQAASGEPPGLFKGADATGPQALSAVGRNRLETLKWDAPTQSIRLVRMVDDLSQQQSLVIQMKNRALAPEVHPVFERSRSTEDETETPETATGTLFIQRDQIRAIEGGTYSWSGTVYTSSRSRTKIGEAILVHGEDQHISGILRVRGDYYLIRPLSNGLHALVEENETKYSSKVEGPRYAGGMSSETSQPKGSSKSRTPSSRPQPASTEQTCVTSTPRLFPNGQEEEISTANTQSNTTAPCPEAATDALVVYTDSAAMGRDIDGLINTAIAEANNAYSNSDIDSHYTLPSSVDLNLAHSQQVEFSTDETLEQDVKDLANNSNIQSLRDQHNADVVVLITADVYGPRGRADEIRAEAGDAYAIIEAPSATDGRFGFTHEVGHLQGAQHNPQAACHPDNPNYPGCDEEGDFFPNAYGHLFSANSNPLQTVMTAPSLVYNKILYFSNPKVSYDGTPTGISDRNNADALATTANTVEYFRTSGTLEARFSLTVYDPDGGVRMFDGNPCGGTGTYSYEWRISYNGPFNYGPPVSTQETFTKVFPEGTHYVKFTATSGSQTDSEVKTVVVDCKPGHQCAGGYTSAKDTASSTRKERSSKQKMVKSRPTQVALHAPIPNPVRTSTEIKYDLPNRTNVRLVVYDLMGREVKQLASGAHDAGTHRAYLDGSILSSGVYVMRLKAGTKQKTRRITVVK